MKKNALFLIILAGLMWGSSGIFVHFLSMFAFTSVQMTCVRVSVSVLVMIGFVFFKDKSLFRASFGELCLYALSGITMFSTAAIYFMTMQITSVSTAVVLMYTSPIFIMIFSVAFLGEKLTVMKTVSIVAMLVGCALVSGVASGMKINLVGVLLGISSGVIYSIYNIVTKIEMRKNCDPKTANLYCFVFATLSALIVSKPWEMGPIIAAQPTVLLLLVACGIVTCIAPYFLYTLALRDLPAGTAASLSIIEPMAATLYSVVFLGEVLNIYSICGIVLILGAVLILSREKE